MDTIHIPREATEAAQKQHGVTVSESLTERQARTLKHGDSFAVLGIGGDLRPNSVDGLYHRDTRHLSRLDLTIGGARPILLSSTVRDDNAALICDLTNPDLAATDGQTVPADTLHIRRVQFLWQGALHERLRVRNFGDCTVRVSLGLGFEADFRDIFEVRGNKRARRGTCSPPEIAPDRITFRYTGLDAYERVTGLVFAPAPAHLREDGAIFDLTLPPGSTEVVFLEAVTREPDREAAGAAGFRCAMRSARRALRRSSSRAAAIETSNDIFNEAVRRSVADIYMLNTDTEHGAYPYAGVPWFSTAFGRDALITAFETLWLDPEMAQGVLRFLAATQATDIDPASDAEPGKILHETRRGEMAETGEVPFRRYYGSVDSTPLFVMLAGAYLERTGDIKTAQELWPAVEAALVWMDDYGDRDGDGFLEYGRMTDAGLVNQGWKDSHDSVFHADGRLAEGPIALCEVQGYAYAARIAAAAVAEAVGEREEAARQRHLAEKLRARFDAAFWCEKIGTYALALDGHKRPCAVRSSNAGHALWTGIALPDRAARVAETLMNRSSFSGWGVRTIPQGEARYNPISYHNGSVWPHDNALVALGLARYGYKAEAARIFEALFDASVHIDLRRLPELFCGFARTRGQGPTFYPVACIPQAWAAATPIALLAACLGLTFDPARNQVEMQTPTLPRFLDHIVLRNLRVGEASLDVEVNRTGDSIAASVLRRTGGGRLLVTH